MAEYGANSIATSDLEKPSIFEVVAQESLSSGLKRGINYLFRVLANNNPERFAYIYRNFDEFYMIFDFVVQFSHLKAYDASFAEKFYNLRRVPCNLTEKNDSQNLPPQQLYSSLFLLVGFPYVRNKLDIVWERLKFAELEGRINKTRNPTQYWFLKIYPVINGVYEFWSLCDHLTYAVGNGRYHSPLLRLAAVQLCNFVHRDAGETSDMSSVNSWTNYFKYLSLKTTKFIAKSVGTGLSVGAFFLQFLDYWFTRENAPPSFAPLPIPPPPETNLIDIPKDTCPLCLQRRRNDTVLSTTGYVFCYRCIKHFVEENQRCPITNYPSTIEHLVKLYPPDR